jgi:RNA polymerase sigma-70 factor (ECF subfamily)
MTKELQDQLFEDLYVKKRKAVIGFCYRYTRDFHEAEDLAHSIFLRVYNSLSTFRGDSSLSTWLYTVCRNSCINYKRYFRTGKRKGAIFSIDKISNSDIDLGGDRFYKYLIDNKSVNALDDACSKESADYIYKNIASLPKNHKEIIESRIGEYEGLSYKECGKRLGISDNGFRQALYRAKIELRKKLNDTNLSEN